MSCAGVTNFGSRDAGFAHENATVDEVLDLVRGSVLKAEQQWVELQGIAHNAGEGKALFAYTSGRRFSPLKAAAAVHAWNAWGDGDGDDACHRGCGLAATRDSR